MVARALGVSFRQALRSVALTLFPLAFIALFAWATAGSTSGNTSDPIRASAWLYLGVHLIPFTVPSGKLTLLPLLAVLYPMWAIRRGLPVVETAFSKINGARLIYATWYALFSELLAVLSRYHGVAPNLYLTPVFTFLIAIIATANFSPTKNRTFFFAGYLFLITLGIGSILFAISLGDHWKVVQSISIVLAPGAVGGVLFAAMQLLYLPNFALTTLSYMTGIGFSFGAHSLINATQLKIGEVPALPFVPALPTSVHRELIYAPFFWLLFFILVSLFIRRTESSIFRMTRSALNQGIRFFIVVAAITYLSAGELLTDTLNPIGVLWWRFTATLGAAYLASSVLVLFIPAGIKKVTNRG